MSVYLGMLITWSVVVIFLPIVVRIFFGNSATKILYSLSAGAALFAIVAIISDMTNGIVTVTFANNFVRLFVLSVFAMLANVIVITIGTTIGKSGSLIRKEADKRSRSQKAQDEYREKIGRRTRSEKRPSSDESERYRRNLKRMFRGD